MGRNRISLQVKGFNEYMAKLDKLGGNDAMKRGVESALKQSKAYINPQIESVINKSNLPAGGRYSKGGTKQSIDKSMNVDWKGFEGEINVGFDFKKSGLKSIVLMYGTPRMRPVAGLKDAIYGGKTQRQIAKLQGEALDKVVKRIMEGK